MFHKRREVFIKLKGGRDIREYCLIFLVLVPASLSDLYCYKVSNVVICIGLSLGLLYRLWTEGVTGVLPWLIGITVPFFLCFILYLCRMAGAADIKLFSVIGSFYSVKFCLKVIGVSFVIAAGMSIWKFIRYQNIRERFRYFIGYIAGLVMTKQVKPYYQDNGRKDEYVVSFAVAISLSYLFCILQID